MAYKKHKRTLSQEQLQKMQEGRVAAQKKREEQAKTKQRVAMLSDLDKRLNQGRKNAESEKRLTFKSHRKHEMHK